MYSWPRVPLLHLQDRSSSLSINTRLLSGQDVPSRSSMIRTFNAPRVACLTRDCHHMCFTAKVDTCQSRPADLGGAEVGRG